ncbi:MAG: T9SS type A sorting domain-containing protein [Bacteroidota bacterium]
MRTILILLFCCFTQMGWGQADSCLAHAEIGISFPPVADQTQRDFARQKLDSLGVKKMRFAEDWALREPTQGNFNWAPLDARIDWVANHGYELLLTIQSRGPAWACGAQNAQSCVVNNLAFRTYLDSLLIRYPNQIAKIQFGNEWQTDFWYVGNAQEYIASNNVLYAAVQAHSPNTEVVLGGFTTSSLRFLAGCNGYVSGFYEDDGTFIDSSFLAANCPTAQIQDVKARIDSVLSQAQYDLIDLHFYDDVEQWDAYYANFTDTIATPIIVTEFGGPNMNVEPYTPVYQANRVYEYIRKLDSLQISEIYFFKLVEGTANPAHSTSGLISGTTLAPKPAFSMVKAFIDCQAAPIAEPLVEEVRMLPNPATDRCWIKFDREMRGRKSVRVYSMAGRLLFREDAISGQRYRLVTEFLPPGCYLVEVRGDGQATGRGKLVIVN